MVSIGGLLGLGGGTGLAAWGSQGLKGSPPMLGIGALGNGCNLGAAIAATTSLTVIVGGVGAGLGSLHQSLKPVDPFIDFGQDLGMSPSWGIIEFDG